jgi:hypothetical protein
MIVGHKVELIFHICKKIKLYILFFRLCFVFGVQENHKSSI